MEQAVNHRTGPDARATWAVILLATAGIALGNAWLQMHRPETDDAASMVVLRMQGRVLVAIDGMTPGLAARELEKTDIRPSTPRLSRALAALHVSLQGEEEAGTRRALEMLEQQRSSIGDPDEIRLHDSVRLAVENPEMLEDADRARIASSMDWFGDLLLARDAAPDDPHRLAVTRESRRALIAVFLLLGAAGAGVLAGLVLLGIALYLRANGRLRFLFVPSRARAGVYLQAFAVYVAAFFLLLTLPSVLGIALPGPLPYLGLVVASVLGVAWPVLRGIPRERAFRDMGLFRGYGWLRETGAGLAGYVAILPIVAAGFMASIVLIMAWQQLNPPAPDDSPNLITHPVVVLMAEGGLAVRIGVLLLASAFAPLFEEAMFRGALYGGMRARMRPVAAGAIMAVIFAIAHPQGILLVPALGALAFGFALLREWRGSLIAPMVGHALHNGTLVIFMWVVFG